MVVDELLGLEGVFVSAVACALEAGPPLLHVFLQGQLLDVPPHQFQQFRDFQRCVPFASDPLYHVQLHRLLLTSQPTEHIYQYIHIDHITLPLDSDDILHASHELATGFNKGGLSLFLPAVS